MSLRTDLDAAIAKFTAAMSYDPVITLGVINAMAALVEAGGGGSSAWGGITGTLSDQADLNSALGGKQATLVSGTNIKTINSTSLLGSTDITLVPTARTVNGKALSGNITLSLASSDFVNQGTATTVLHGNASGNPTFSGIAIADLTATGTPSSSTFLRGDNTWASVSAAPGGSDTQVQFNSSSSFAGDAKFVWDYTNHRLNIGSPDPANATQAVNIVGKINHVDGTTGGAGYYTMFPDQAHSYWQFSSSGAGPILTIGNNGGVFISRDSTTIATTATLELRGSGTANTSTAFKVRNATPTDIFVITNDGTSTFGGAINARGFTVGTLPTPITGMIAYVTDSSVPVIGNAVASGGAAFAGVMYNGSQWTVFSK